MIEADLLLILSDIDGVYTADPRIVPTAKKLEEISYDEMLELESVLPSQLALHAAVRATGERGATALLVAEVRSDACTLLLGSTLQGLARTDKPAFWADGNIHAAELTAGAGRQDAVAQGLLQRGHELDEAVDSAEKLRDSALAGGGGPRAER